MADVKSEQIIWVVNGNTNSPITNVSISKDTGKTNMATFTSTYPFETGNYVYITTKTRLAESKSDNRNAPFNGYVIKCTGFYNRFNVTCEDASALLKSIKAQAQTNSGFTPNIIIRRKRSNGHINTINNYLNYIIDSGEDGLNQTNQKIILHDKSNLGNTTKIPETDVDLPNVMISHMSLGGALNKFLVDILGLNVWYEFNKVSGDLEISYGLYRDPIRLDYTSKNEVIIGNEMIDSVVYPPMDCVTVINDDATIVATYGDPTSKKCITYRIDGTYNDKELYQIAKKIQSDRNVKRMQYKVAFPPGTCFTFKEGDYFDGIGDATLGEGAQMEYKSGSTDGWKIYRINFTSAGTDVYVGDTYRTVFDIYNDKLREVDGSEAPSDIIENDLGKITIPPDPEISEEET